MPTPSSPCSSERTHSGEKRPPARVPRHRGARPGWPIELRRGHRPRARRTCRRPRAHLAQRRQGAPSDRAAGSGQRRRVRRLRSSRRHRARCDCRAARLGAMSLAMHRPDLVRDLVLVEPARDGGTGRRHRHGVDAFMRIVCAADYRAVLDASLGPGGLPRWDHESTFFFTNEVPAFNDWAFDDAAAARIHQPVRTPLQRRTSPSRSRWSMGAAFSYGPHSSRGSIHMSSNSLPSGSVP